MERGTSSRRWRDTAGACALAALTIAPVFAQSPHAEVSLYYLYEWSSNPSQGDPAQVVGAGNLSYTFNRFVTFGAGITSLPAVRSTEGQFPYWSRRRRPHDRRRIQ